MEKRKTIGSYLGEFLTIFIGIFAAFALDNWNEDRKDAIAGRSILVEIKNGLDQDLKDLEVNAGGHKFGLAAAAYYRNVLLDKKVDSDSAAFHYFNLFRSFVAVQNGAGFQTLKSKGLDIIGNDSLRMEILALYENDYNTIRKLEESYSETQYQAAYFGEFNTVLAPNFIIDTIGNLRSLKLPLMITPKEKAILLTDLWKISNNRRFLLGIYGDVEGKIHLLQERIKGELDSSK